MVYEQFLNVRNMEVSYTKLPLINIKQTHRITYIDTGTYNLQPMAFGPVFLYCFFLGGLQIQQDTPIFNDFACNRSSTSVSQKENNRIHTHTN